MERSFSGTEDTELEMEPLSDKIHRKLLIVLLEHSRKAAKRGVEKQGAWNHMSHNDITIAQQQLGLTLRVVQLG
eukprot:5942359-Amphidinium_carterae.1